MKGLKLKVTSCMHFYENLYIAKVVKHLLVNSIMYAYHLSLCVAGSLQPNTRI